MEIGIDIQETDALRIKSDVLILKYAQEFHGVDSAVFSRLALIHKNLERKLPKPGELLLLESFDSLGSNYVLFAGVDGLSKFRYKEIRDFSFRSLKRLAEIKVQAEHICFTLHGANYGLDETEAFTAEVAGIADALTEGSYPSGLRRISIAEIYEPRAKRLRGILGELFAGGVIKVGINDGRAERSLHRSILSEAGINSEDKPLIFVAMPFDKKMDDIFHYGIRNAVNNAGFLCERADEVVFTGDILDLIKRRIAKASLVIADLTTANPNVYLEVGYAWGRGIPTLLLAQDAQELKFDVKGQKCIIYSGIKELEENLAENF